MYFASDYTFCPVRKPKAGGVASTSSSRASTPAPEANNSARPAITRRATAPSSRTTPYSPRKRRITSDNDYASQNVTVHMPPSLLGLDFGLSNHPRNDHQGFVPHSVGSYQSDFALECGMDALLTSFSQSTSTSPVGAFPMSASPSMSSYSPHHNAAAAVNIDYSNSTDPSAHHAWTTFEASTPHYFPEHNSFDLLPQPPMSAPAAFSTFDFGPVPSIFDPRPLPSPSASHDFSSFESAVGSASTSGSFPLGGVDHSGFDTTSPTTTESSLASPIDSRFPLYEQWLPAPMEMQWEGAEGASGDVNGEAEYKRRFSAQWMASQHPSSSSGYPQQATHDYSFPSAAR